MCLVTEYIFSLLVLPDSTENKQTKFHQNGEISMLNFLAK